MKIFTVRVPSTGTSFPEKFWSFLLWPYSNPIWIWSCATCLRWGCSTQGLDDLQQPLPAPTILWPVSLERTFLYSSTAYPCRPTAHRNSIPYDHNFPLKWGTGNSQSCGRTDVLKGFSMCLYSGWITSSPSWEARNAETEDWCIYSWEVFLCYWFRQKIRPFNSLKARVFRLNVYICVYLEKGMIDTLLWSYFQTKGKERFCWKQYICLYLLPVKDSRGKLINNSVG